MSRMNLIDCSMRICTVHNGFELSTECLRSFTSRYEIRILYKLEWWRGDEHLFIKHWIHLIQKKYDLIHF
jgi:hypothetical protein